MPSWIADSSGRFPQRLYLRTPEIDRDCEMVVSEFLLRRHGVVRYPLSTAELTVLVEEHANSLDQYADLSAEGDDVEGMTCFQPGGRPDVLISKHLTNQPHRENRLRTTLAHEFGHVFYHRAVYDQLFAAPPGLFPTSAVDTRTVCKRDTMVQAGEGDWLEWQAGYVCGALLMPVTAIRRLIADLLMGHGIHGAAVAGTPAARAAETRIMEEFLVSADAARVRLRRLSLLSDTAGPPTLFDRP